MNTVRITREQMLKKLSESFNPPELEGHVPTVAFRDEFWGVRSGLISCLEGFGKHDVDFGIGEDIIASRGIGIDISNAAMLQPEVILAIQSYLTLTTPEYEVYFSFFVDDEMADAFVQRKIVYSHCSDEGLVALGWI